MTESICIIKGNIIYTSTPQSFTVIPEGYLVARGETVQYCGPELPEQYKMLPVADYGDSLIIPGFVDVHCHAPQFSNRGLGMDKELLPWLETYTFPEEAKFNNLKYASLVYSKFVTELWRQGTTRSVIFGTIHTESTLLLMEFLAQAGLCAYVGKVNMDRNSPKYLCETTENSIKHTIQWLCEACTVHPHVKPIITPRFVPSCSGELMEELGRIAREYHLPVQSHLSENHGEVEWVAQLHPHEGGYARVYHSHGLLGQEPTVMAHCIHLTEEETELLAATGTMVAHCPFSNNNLSSGIAPIRKLLSKGVKVGLASDISGGHHLSMPKVVTEAVQVSKLKWAEVDGAYHPLTLSESFYMATKGGGAFFGKAGAFDNGFYFDALVVDDTDLLDPNQRSLEERLERWLYVGDDRHIKARYVNGKKIEKPVFELD